MTDFEQQLRTWWAKLNAWLRGGQPAEGGRKAKAALQDFRESETGRKRKYYSLKKDGKTAMAKHHEQWSLVHSVLAGLKKEQYV